MRFVISILAILNVGSAFSQVELEVKSLSVPEDKKVDKVLTIPDQFSDHLQCEQELKDRIRQLHDLGYLEAAVETSLKDTAHIVATLLVGKKWEWAQLRAGNVEEEILNKIGYHDKLYRNKPFHYRAVADLLEAIVVHCENNGWPFASVKLDSLGFHGESISASLTLKKNRLFVIDSVKVIGDARISDTYLQNHIKVRQGEPYNEERMRQIRNRIKELPFLKETKPPQVIFSDKQCKLVLYLDKKNASRVNGVLGVLPDDETSKILLTGDAQLKLHNAFGRGEIGQLNWRKLQEQTNDLKVDATIPYLFSTPFGIEAGLKLYKRDTTFTSVHQQFGLQYILSGGNYFKGFVQRDESTLISTSGLENLTTLPEHADVQALAYGLGFRTEKLDYRLNPRKGIRFDATASIGTKTILKNPKLVNVEYDSLNLKTTQYRIDLDLDYFIPIGKRSTFNIGMLGGYLENETMFTNELYRIGGLRTLRGFDEESINASAFAVATFEYRYILEQNSYFHIFWDGAYYENTAADNTIYGTPFGFGAGVSFETKAGIFSVNYALGQHITNQFTNDVQLRSGKLHFGFVNTF